MVLDYTPNVHQLRILCLTLGPDLPRADEPSPGILEFQTDGILTHLIVTYTGILTSIQSNIPLGISSSRIERSPTIIVAYNPQLR